MKKLMVFNETLKEIGREAFVGCCVVNLVIPDSVAAVKSGAFHANSIEHRIIGKSIKEINRDTFNYGQLKDMVLPEGLEIIDNYAFWSNNPGKITIPNSVRKIIMRLFLKIQ
jgi:hypothetical protein